MMKKIKIIESNCTPKLKKTINKLLKKDWVLMKIFAMGSNIMVAMVVSHKVCK